MVDCTENRSNCGREAAWRDLVDGVQALYPEPLPPTEAEAAAHNLATFFKLLMDADREQRLKNQQKKTLCYSLKKPFDKMVDCPKFYKVVGQSERI